MHTAFVELDSHFRTVMQQGGSGDRLVQTFTTTAQSHSYISDPTYPTLLAALLTWATAGVKPTPAGIAAACAAFEAQFGAGCSIAPGYTPAALETRVVARERLWGHWGAKARHQFIGAPVHRQMRRAAATPRR